MGEEWGETRPFLFFTDFQGELAAAVREGRRHEFAGFAAFSGMDVQSSIPDPNNPTTFQASKLDWSRCRGDGREALARLRELLALRLEHVIPHLSRSAGGCGSLLRAEDGEIAVDWRLADRLWQLRANLSSGTASLPPTAGRRVFTTGHGEPDDAPPLWAGFWSDDKP
jgi:1,4-alpha-glucan branching enzyme